MVTDILHIQSTKSGSCSHSQK